jgi:hypothetical protein
MSTSKGRAEGTIEVKTSEPGPSGTFVAELGRHAHYVLDYSFG